MRAAAIARVAASVAVAALVALFAAAAAADGAADAISARYAEWQRQAAAIGPPIAVSSYEQGRRVGGDIDGIVAVDFDALADRLRSPRDWCGIALLHLNVKACTHERLGGGETITLYGGGKRYEPPDDAYAVRYAFRDVTRRADYVALELAARAGPLDTSEYAIVVEAMPAGPQKSFVHLRYTYRTSPASRLATAAYLATAGSGKKGFSVIGRTPDGRPAYVGGLRGIVERNAVRNFLAIEAFAASGDDGANAQPARRFERWFDLTERYSAQLHELDRGEYVAAKLREYRQQVELQKTIDASDAAAG